MTTINSRGDLNRAVASIMCEMPPLSERRAIHESGAWMWISKWDTDNHRYRDHWEPADFCGDPAASYRLKQWMVSQRWWCQVNIGLGINGCAARYSKSPEPNKAWSLHTSELIALCLAVCAAYQVELDLQPDWEGRCRYMTSHRSLKIGASS